MGEGEGEGEKLSALQLSPFFASIFPLSPQKRLILRLQLLDEHSNELSGDGSTSALHILNFGSRAPNAFVAAWIPLSTSRSEKLVSVTVVL